MLPRVHEAEVMDTEAEAREYDAMDFTEVNRVFREQFWTAWADWGGQGTILDVCTGTARIPIEICSWYKAADDSAAGILARCFGTFPQIIAVDLADHMLALAKQNVEAAGFAEQITLLKADAKQLPFPAGHFGAVFCNGSVHHIPDPFACFAEMHRVCAVGGTIFVRDLLRPATRPALDAIVNQHAAEANNYQRAMFAASLGASLTLDEVRAAVGRFGYEPETVQQTSDRHWTWAAIRSG
jgi:ubiquinone/menaquinone biosynthesis C-methylase UbiE